MGRIVPLSESAKAAQPTIHVFFKRGADVDYFQTQPDSDSCCTKVDNLEGKETPDPSLLTMGPDSDSV